MSAKNAQTRELHQLAEHYDNTDTADQMGGGQWIDEPAQAPMVTTSLRLPAEVMQAVRTAAQAEGVKPTALIRRWIEAALTNDATHVAATPENIDLLRQIRDEVHEVRGAVLKRA